MGDAFSGCCCDPVVPWFDLLIADDALLDFADALDDRTDFFVSPTLPLLLEAYPAAAYISPGSTHTQFIGPSSSETPIVDEEFNLPRKSSIGTGDSYSEIGFKYDLESFIRTKVAASDGVTAVGANDLGANGFLAIRHSIPLEGAACLVFYEYIDEDSGDGILRKGVVFLDGDGSIAGSAISSGDRTAVADIDKAVPFIQNATGRYAFPNDKFGIGDGFYVTWTSVTAAAQDPVQPGFRDIDGDGASDATGPWNTSLLHTVNKNGTITLGYSITLAQRDAGTAFVRYLLGLGYPKSFCARYTGLASGGGNTVVEYGFGDHTGGTADNSVSGLDSVLFESESAIGSGSSQIIWAAYSDPTYAAIAVDFHGSTHQHTLLKTNAGSLILGPTTAGSTHPFFINADSHPTTANTELRHIDEVTDNGHTYGIYGTGTDSDRQYILGDAQWRMFLNGDGKAAEPDQADFICLIPWVRERTTIQGPLYTYGADLLFFTGTTITAVKRTLRTSTESQYGTYEEFGIIGCSDRYAYVNFGRKSGTARLQMRFRRDGKAQQEINARHEQDDANGDAAISTQWQPIATSVEAENTMVPWDAVDNLLGNFTSNP